MDLLPAGSGVPEEFTGQGVADPPHPLAAGPAAAEDEGAVGLGAGEDEEQALTVTSFAPHLAVDSPRGAWTALYYYSFMAILMLACAIPLRASPVPRSTAVR